MQTDGDHCAISTSWHVPTWACVWFGQAAIMHMLIIVESSSTLASHDLVACAAVQNISGLLA